MTVDFTPLKLYTAKVTLTGRQNADLPGTKEIVVMKKLLALALAGMMVLSLAACGGATIQGIRALEEAGFRGAVMDAVIAAWEKSTELK